MQLELPGGYSLWSHPAQEGGYLVRVYRPSGALVADAVFKTTKESIAWGGFVAGGDHAKFSLLDAAESAWEWHRDEPGRVD